MISRPGDNPTRYLWLVRWVVIVLTVLAGACGGEDPTAAPTESRRDRIMNGDLYLTPSNSGIVMITGLSFVEGGAQQTLGSGVLLTNEWVLTAGHVFNFDPDLTNKPYTVHMGGLDPTATFFLPDDQVRLPTQLIFTPFINRVDVALVHLDRPMFVNGTNTGFKNKLFRGNTPSLQGQSCTGYGYGLSGFPGPGVLRWAQFPINQAFTIPNVPAIDLNPFGNTYLRIAPGTSLFGQPTMIAGGDSGGPCYGGDGTEIVGIAHAGGGNVGFYIATEAFRDWVDQILGESNGRDYTGDDETDFFWRNQVDGSNLVWPMHFKATGSNPPVPTADLPGISVLQIGSPANFRVIGGGDWNRDGFGDILFAFDGFPGVTVPLVLFGDNGASRFSTFSFLWPFPTTTGFDIVATGDLTGDGIPDIIFRNVNTGQNWMWVVNELSGAAATDFKQTVQTGLSLPDELDPTWEIALVGDFDRASIDPNNTPHTRLEGDIFWRNNVTGQNHIWYMQFGPPGTGMQIRRTDDLPVQPTVFRADAIGDYTHDGWADIVWRRTDNGLIEIWGTSRDWNTLNPADVRENGTLHVNIIAPSCGDPCAFTDFNFQLVAP